MALRTAVETRAAQARLTAVVLAQIRKSWQRMDYGNLDGSWPRIAANMLLVLTAAQRASAAHGADSVGRMLVEQNTRNDPDGQVNPAAFAGVASDGRPLETLLYQPVIATKTAIGAGADQGAALAAGAFTLDKIVTTQLFDAHRVASGVGVTIRHSIGYIREVGGNCCSRCAVLAGRWYRWQADFERHVGCMCTQVPAGDGANAPDPKDLFEQGRITDLSKAEQQAISDGADISRVVNAHRGMSTASIAGRKVSITSELRSARHAGIRITPGQIYRDATDRDDAVRLLRRFGYIT